MQKNKIKAQSRRLSMSAPSGSRPDKDFIVTDGSGHNMQHPSLEPSGGSRVPMAAEHLSRSRHSAQRNFLNLKWLNSAQITILWAVVLVVLAISLGIYLQQVSKTAIVGRNTELIDRQVTKLRDSNNLILRKITIEQSLATMQQRSFATGALFQEVDPASAEYIEVIIEPQVDETTPTVLTLELPPDTFAGAAKIYLRDYFQTFGRGVADGN